MTTIFPRLKKNLNGFIKIHLMILGLIVVFVLLANLVIVDRSAAILTGEEYEDFEMSFLPTVFLAIILMLVGRFVILGGYVKLKFPPELFPLPEADPNDPVPPGDSVHEVHNYVLRLITMVNGIVMGACLFNAIIGFIFYILGRNINIFHMIEASAFLFLLIFMPTYSRYEKIMVKLIKKRT